MGTCNPSILRALKSFIGTLSDEEIDSTPLVVCERSRFTRIDAYKVTSPTIITFNHEVVALKDYLNSFGSIDDFNGEEPLPIGTIVIELD